MIFFLFTNNTQVKDTLGYRFYRNFTKVEASSNKHKTLLTRLATKAQQERQNNNEPGVPKALQQWPVQALQ